MNFIALLLETEGNSIGQMFKNLWNTTGFMSKDIWLELAMLCIGFFLMYLAIAKKFEPNLLVGIAFGVILINIPGAHDVLMAKPADGLAGGFFYYIYKGVEWDLFPPLIFIGIGAMTDFGPLIANPKSLLLGAAAQLGIFITFVGALLLGAIPGIGFTAEQAAAIGIIGGADGPTSIYVATKLAPDMVSQIAIAAYSYMALVPIIQPPIMKLLTTKKERMIRMEQLRQVSKKEKIIFPIAVTAIVGILLPSAVPLVGCLMLGNIFKESGVVPRLKKTAENELLNIITIMLGVVVGAQAYGPDFLNLKILGIMLLGIIAFSFGTAGGLLLGKLMCKLSKGKINPLIGAAGVSAVPMAARVAQDVGAKEDPTNYLLMHAMGPNVAGVIGSAVAAGLFIAILG